MAKYKIGITEAGDAGLDLSWEPYVDNLDGVVLVTKNITPSFHELAIMGMPCYASPDGPIFCGNQQALFAPPSAFCSAEFFSPYWTKVRQAELRRINCPDP